MAPDSFYSLCVLGIFLLVISYKKFSDWFLEAMVKLTRPGATILVLGSVLGLFMRQYFYTALALALVSVYLLKDVWRSWPDSDARRLYLEVGRDQIRFDPSHSIDLQMAEKSVTFAPPAMFSEAKSETMLVFPPSEETLREMNGD